MSLKAYFSLLLFFPFFCFAQNDCTVAYYPFNGNANDESGNGNDGVVNGTTLAEDRFGNSNSAYRFDGVDDFIEVADDQSLRLGNDDYSISIWTKVEAYTNRQAHALISKRSDFVNEGYLLNVYGIAEESGKPQGQINFSGSGSENSRIESNAIVPLNDWRHLVIVSSKAENTSKLYVNGELDTVITFLPFNTEVTTNLFFGKDDLSENSGLICCDGYHFNGLLDDIGIYCEALTEEDIAELYTPAEKEPLVAHYPFNGNANDESGNGNDGVVNGATLAADRFGNPNSAYRFDGVDDFIEVADDQSLRLGNDDYSISIWTKVEAYTNRQAHALISKRSDFVNEGYLLNVYGIAEESGKPQGQINFSGSGSENSRIESNAIVPLNDWRHLVIVSSKAENTSKLYVNGELDTVITFLPFNTEVTTNLFFGKDDLSENSGLICCDGYHFNGLLDDIGIYCEALTEEDIAELYTPAEKEPLVAHYPFNGNANDESGNGNDGEVNGATLAADRFGNPNSAYRFDGVDDFIEIQDNESLRLGNTSYTISLWASVDEFTNEEGHSFFSKRTSINEEGYLFSTFGNNRMDGAPQGQLAFVASGGSNPNLLSNTNLLTDEWYNIVIVASEEENSTKIYVNGVLDSSTSYLALNPNTTANLFIGKDELTEDPNVLCCDGFHFNGLLDDISIYCEALTAEEIVALYQPAPVDGKATVQLIHNVEAQNAILRINGEVLVNNARYRSATPYLELEAGEYEIDIVPLGAGEIFSTAISVAPNRTYQLVANGTFDINDDYPIEIAILESARSSSDSDKVDIQFHNGSAGSTALSLQNQGDLLFEQVEFGEFGNDYVSLMPNNYLFDLLSSGNTIESFLARLKRRGGKSALIFASGSIEANSKGLWIAFSDGKTFPLTRISQSATVEAIVETRDYEGHVNISPNPTNGALNLKLMDYKNRNINIVLYNSIGQEVKMLFNGQVSDDRMIISSDLSDLSKGIYFMKIKFGRDQSYDLLEKIIVK